MEFLKKVELLVVFCMVFLAGCGGGSGIDVWYGHNQKFGQVGTPQKWVNILGNVADSNNIDSLVYSLNDGNEVSLAIGPDTRRLSRAGDFNIDIARNTLKEGENKVLIKAVDKQGGISTEMVVVNYTKDKVWQLPYKIEWGRVADIGDVAEIVDGKWVITSDGVRIAEAGYDRLIAIGDLNWTDYEITVPITIHKVDTQTGPVSGGAAVGILMRWTGHTDNPRAGWQPKAGWIPNGAIGWWRGEKGKDLSRLEFYVIGGQRSFVPKLGVRYIFKMRVKSVYGRGGMYKLKVWEDGQSEPAKWSLTFGANPSNLGYGSLLLIAHHVDATYGDIVVKKVQ